MEGHNPFSPIKSHNMQTIKQLIDLFIEGETSLEQERTLYAYFAQQDIAPELEEYREMFQGFAVIDQSARDKSEVVIPRSKRKSMRLPLITAMSVAASIALIFGIFTFADKQEEKRLKQQYEGSYMIVNGERIDDLQKMKPEIERILAYAELMERSTSISDNLQRLEEHIIMEEQGTDK